jgi:hypothetical protein
MKEIPKQFVCNADKSGDHTFTQIKRDDLVFLYQRAPVETNKVKGYEVFVAKVVPQGAPLPNGTAVSESYEQYPGAAAFGKTAWYFNHISGAEKRFAELVEIQKNKAISIANGTYKSRGRKPKGYVAKS